MSDEKFILVIADGSKEMEVALRPGDKGVARRRNPVCGSVQFF